MPVDEIVPTVPYEVWRPVTQQSEYYRPLVQRAVRLGQVAQRFSLQARHAA